MRWRASGSLWVASLCNSLAIDAYTLVWYNRGMQTVLTYRYRLYPTPAQQTVLCETLETCRGLYNSLLNERKHDYEVYGKAPSCYDQQKRLPAWKETHPELSTVFSQVLQNVAKRVGLAFDAFFRRVQTAPASGYPKPGYPRFKGRGQYDSITYPQAGFKIEGQAVCLSKIGTVKARLHRPLDGRVKTCTARRMAGKWFVCFSVEVEAEPFPLSGEQIGIDVGLNHFAVTDNAQFIPNPRFFRKDEKALAKAQRKLALQKRGTFSGRPKRRKAKKVVARIHERIRNRRHDFVHQLARKIVNLYGLIAVEELCVDNMSTRPKPKPDAENTGQFLPNGAGRKAGLNKSIADAAWSMFRAVLTQKAESAARVVIAVNPAYTSQTCSECGCRVPKTLEIRVHTCPIRFERIGRTFFQPGFSGPQARIREGGFLESTDYTPK